ncbi:MAG: hypothetical protein EP330_24450 [Deltaproteobacteria bacterium]|nr:MAG: hypothetical protein EP330_24450 [Deltaproteobacteria bacterium]
MALRTLSIGLAALALAGCSGGNGTTECPVGQVDIDGTCCTDANSDGACDSECTAPFIDDGAGNCVCPAGQTDDGAGACCPDVDGDAACDPVYASPESIAVSSYYGFDAADTGAEIQEYAYTYNSTDYTDLPALFVGMYDANLAFVCGWYIELDETTATLPNQTSFTTYDDQGNETTPTTTVSGFTLDLTTATVTDISEFSSTASPCDGQLDPAIWGDDVAASIAAGTANIGIGNLGTMATDHANYSQIQGFYEAAEWTAEWDGKIMDVGMYFDAYGFIPSVGWAHARADADSGDGAFDIGDWDTATFLASGSVHSGMAAIETDSYALNVTAQNMPYLILGLPAN